MISPPAHPSQTFQEDQEMMVEPSGNLKFKRDEAKSYGYDLTVLSSGESCDKFEDSKRQ